MLIENILIEGARELGITLPDRAPGLFRRYAEVLQEKNKVLNLTAIEGEKEIAELHFLDSLALLAVYQFPPGRLIDVGSGAGFPGVPIKVALPELDVTLLDAHQKRVAFLNCLCHELGLVNVTCVHARAEEAGQLTGMRDSFDVAVARAVSRLNVLCELCLPFVAAGGVFIAMKSLDTDEEIRQAESAISELGSVLFKVEDYKIPGTDIPRRAVVIRKTAPTPDKYPRRYAKIIKAPL